jgi:FMN phosphatase YigB (HAD superfamily)
MIDSNSFDALLSDIREKDLVDIRLSDLFKLQMIQNKNWIETYEISEIEKIEYIKEYVLGIIKNSTNVLGRIDWQKHIVERENIVVNSLIYKDLIDIMKYFISLTFVFGIKYEDWIKEFLFTTEMINDEVVKNKMDINENIKIVSIDLDGVIADFHTGIINYFFKKGYVGHDVYDKEHNNYSYQEFFKTWISDPLYIEKYKNNFLEEDGFKYLSLFNGSKEFIDNLISLGYNILILTARSKKYISDTIFWLKNNNIAYHHLIFEKDKSDAFLSLYPSKIILHIDDRDKHCIEVSSNGIETILLNKPYNSQFDIIRYENIHRFDDFDQIYDYVRKIKWS